MATYICGQKFPYTDRGHRFHGILGLLIISLKCFFFQGEMIVQRTSLMTLQNNTNVSDSEGSTMSNSRHISFLLLIMIGW